MRKKYINLLVSSFFLMASITLNAHDVDFDIDDFAMEIHTLPNGDIRVYTPKVTLGHRVFYISSQSGLNSVCETLYSFSTAIEHEDNDTHLSNDLYIIQSDGTMIELEQERGPGGNNLHQRIVGLTCSNRF